MGNLGTAQRTRHSYTKLWKSSARHLFGMRRLLRGNSQRRDIHNRRKDGFGITMGYYTYYTITADYGTSELKSEMKKFEFLDKYDEGSWSGDAKWYDWSDDMTKLSKKFPDILFTIEGRGEDSTDIWGYYYKDGKSYIQTEVIIHDYPDAPESSPPTMVLFGKDKRDDTKYSFE